MAKIHNLVTLNRVAEVRRYLNANPNSVNSRDRYGQYPLHCIDWTHGERMLQTLLTRSARPRVFNRGGDTPFHYGLLFSATLAECKLLVSADPGLLHLKDGDGNAPLLTAALFCDEQVVSWLLSEGVNVNPVSKNGNTALMLGASRKGKIAHLLVEYGAKVNLKNDYGETALHFAAGSGRLSTVVMLLDHGADPGFSNQGDQTPLDQAEKHGHLRIAKVLRGVFHSRRKGRSKTHK